ncbi:MAG: isoleucine--tRNA ligase [Candidatus Micrarchaeota archaeon]|nr:isoleucine--tRNA ligase [Candidatus Micrarchaeota archaeon]
MLSSEFPKSEAEVLEYWRSHSINQRIRERNSGRKKFYFLDGPPFVSGDLHPGQMWVKTIKDTVIRYRRLRGYDVYDKSGYDVHGLPIENKVEVKLQIKSKKEIESIGLENFIKECRAFVEGYKGRMRSDYEKFGMSLDFENPYMPSDIGYMEKAWGIFKKISEKRLIYEDKRAMMYCPHCETVIAQGSLEIEYSDDNDPSIFVAFKITKNSPKLRERLTDSSLLIWTTTPWTIPSNVAVMANPKETYVKAEIDGRRLVLAKARLEYFTTIMKTSAVVIAEFPGSELEGLRYESPLGLEIPKQKELGKYHRIIFSEQLVSMGEGTGLVHTAPGHGLEDYTIGKLNKLPIFSPVDMHARYTGDAGKFAGMKVPSEANAAVLDTLKGNGALINRGSITHSYPHCWRCKEKLIQLATDQWFINVKKIKRKLISSNSKVRWYPEDALKWQEALLANSPDWCISRQRYWGIPIPIWRCAKCSHITVIGSLDELRKKAIGKEDAARLSDIHRPYIDRIKVRCDSCGEETERIKDVFDVWFDSSVAFSAGLSPEEFDHLFPVDFISEAIEQLRGWFSYQLKVGTIVYGKSPFKNVFTHGMMLDSQGRKMSKSMGNFIELSQILEKMSADAFRLHCLLHVPQLDFPFSIEKARDSQKCIITLQNVSALLREYSAAAGYASSRVKPPSAARLEMEERWIISRMNTVILNLTADFDSYMLHKGVEELTNFIINDFSRFYLKLAKKKILYSRKSEAKRVIDTINYILYTTTVLISPGMPFTAERVFLENYSARYESVFFEKWPKAKPALVDKNLEEDFKIAEGAITAILSSREKAQIRLRWPIGSALLEVDSDAANNSLQRMSNVISEYTNVKSLQIKEVSGISEEIKPNFARIGPDFKGDAALVARGLAGADPKKLRSDIEQHGHYSLHTDKGLFDIKQEHFNIIQKAEESDAVLFRHGRASVDKTINRELREEALLREFERRVQIMRKEYDLKKIDRIHLEYAASGEMAEAISKNIARLKKTINAPSIKAGVDGQGLSQDFDIEGETVKIAIKKI